MKITLVFASLAMVGASYSQVLYQTGFEAPFSAGTNGSNINGQQTWTGFGTSANLKVAANGQVIAGGVTAAAGTQMLALTTPTSSSNSGWAGKDITAAWAGRTAGNNNFHTSMQVFVPTGNVRSTIFGIQIYNTALKVIGEWYLRPRDSSGNFYFQFDTIDAAQTALVDGFAYNLNPSLKGKWNTIDLYLNQDTLKMSCYMNGSSLGTANVDPVLGITPLQFTLATAQNAGTTQVGTTAPNAYVYMDNYLAEAVPEPGSLIAIGAALTALIARRRK